ncbi:MFS transporter [Nocardioides aquiterrae]|uniref:MFS transporter n=1 Tax=Nocardioides aquiterrae TaxID=203799 RepID=A0ABN1UEM5_9ACTN
MSSLSAETSATAGAPPTTWAPLRIAVFRWLWIGALVSNIGTWMQTVGAQWLLVHEPNAATLVSLVQTAQALPVLLLAMPAGVLADSFDRRWLLIGVQGFQTVVALLLTVLTAADRMTPGLLLSLTFALGAGAALQAPAYQAVVPDLVPRPLIPNASVLGSINVNIARAIGPAIAGVVVARAGVPAVFALNVVSFVVFGLVLLAWRREPDARGSEPFLPALLAGGRYVRHSRVVRRLLLRCTMFVVPANVLWALLALVARDRLGLGAGGYGVMLGALGIGSIGGAFLLPRVRSRLTTNGLVAAAMVLYAAALLVLVVTPTAWLGVLALLPAGVAWVGVLSTLNANLQTFLPVWVRARGLAVYQLVLFGSMAGAAAAWGAVADAFGLTTAYVAAAVLLVVGAVAGALLPLRDTSGLDRSPAMFWPEPRVAIDAGQHPGEVLVTTTYHVSGERRDELLALAPDLRRMRRRTGGTSWALYVDAADPTRYVEQYTVASWAEHLLQHSGRLTATDRDLDLRARALSDPPTEVAHLFTARLPGD